MFDANAYHTYSFVQTRQVARSRVICAHFFIFFVVERAVQDIRMARDRLHRLPDDVHRLDKAVRAQSVRRQALRRRIRHGRRPGHRMAFARVHRDSKP